MAESFITYPPDSTGKQVRTISESIGGQTVHTGFVTFRQMPTFYIFAQGVVPAVGRLITVLNRNTATKVCRIWRANMYVSINTVVTGVVLQARIDRCTHTAALSGGTAVTPILADTAESFPANIDVMTRATNAITSVGGIKQFMMSSDEAVVTTYDADALSSEEFPRDTYALFKCDIPLVKPIVLRPQATVFEGFNIEGLAGTFGNLGLEILMTVSDE